MWRRKGKETVNISVLSRSREIRSTVPLLSSVKELEGGDDCCSSVRGDGIISCRL